MMTKTEKNIRIKIKGDERLEIKEPRYIDVLFEDIKTWADIEKQVEELCILKSEWDTKNYGIYDFKLNNEKGEKLISNSPIEKAITVYVRTNYVNFKWNGTILKGYNGVAPRGKIIIPSKTTKISLSEGAITDIDLSTASNLNTLEIFENNITNLDLSSCKNLKSLYVSGTSIKNLDLSSCLKLTRFELSGTLLKNLDLSYCQNLTELEFSWSNIESIDLSPCQNLKRLELNRTKITSINLLPCKNLRELIVWGTPISKIDVSSCLELTKF